MVKKIVNNKFCYLCGKTGVLTDDHVPPRCLSPKSPNSSFFHLPAHKDCNEKLSHQESVLRDFLATAGAKKNCQSADDAFENMKRNFSRNLICRAGLPHKDLVRIVKNIEKRAITTPQGIYLGAVKVVKPPSDIDISPAIIKIARGLHYQFYKEVVPENYEMTVEYIRKIVDLDIYNHLNCRGNTGGFMHFRGGAAEDEKKCGIWYIVFYKEVGVRVMFFPKNILSDGK